MDVFYCAHFTRLSAVLKGWGTVAWEVVPIGSPHPSGGAGHCIFYRMLWSNDKGQFATVSLCIVSKTGLEGAYGKVLLPQTSIIWTSNICKVINIFSSFLIILPSGFSVL